MHSSMFNNLPDEKKVIGACSCAIAFVFIIGAAIGALTILLLNVK